METWGRQIILVVAVVVLTSLGAGLVVYGMTAHNGRLAILGISITFFAATVLVMLFCMARQALMA